MRNIAICGRQIENSIFDRNFVETIQMNEVPVYCGLIHTKEPPFDRHSLENQFNVLVKKRAFSCNYRDKHLIFRMTTKGTDDGFYVVGSDFVGKVVDIGSQVTDLQIGDRVIGNNAYPESGVDGISPGVPTNNASKEYQVFHQVKLLKIPQEMPDEVAAAFSIGAQTTYSMIRKLQITKDSNILVTAAKSNTSLFAINALKKHRVNVYATTTSRRFEEELKAMGVKEVILVEPLQKRLTENQTLQKIASDIGGFDCVIDPFFDLHLSSAVDLMAAGGRYITCGLYDQYFSLIDRDIPKLSLDSSHIMLSIMLKNLQIIGNCIGQTQDLKDAIRDYSSGILKVAIDSAFSNRQVGTFFRQTYNAKDRFGKVVYVYD
jgi:NADPH:quinone reductase-like Zn-dependent oxidoreductase